MEDLRARFLLEARAAGSLRHPAAVAIYDAAKEFVDRKVFTHLNPRPARDVIA